LPLYLFIFKVIKSKDKLFKKILKSLGIFFFVIPFSFIVDLIILFVFLTLFYWTGIIKYPMEIIGQSMMPTLTNHQYLYMHPYNNWMFWKSKINRGDIITFKDDKTDGKTYVKRIVGLPGDDLEIRNGFIYINGKLIDEPYASKYRSTYGGTFLSECKEIKIPQNNIFAMGDNRAGSKDSREIGYVLISDIQTILYYDEQNFLSDRWKNGNKSKDVNVSMLSVSDYVQLVNKLRADNNLKPLKLNSGLTKSAELRANAMLKFDDLSLTATKSGYPMSRSMADAGYGNTIYVEYPVLGYYDANDLYNYVIEISKDKNFLLDKDFQDIGIATVIGNLNNCPVQLVLQQVAGYIPPNYKAETIDSWGRVINNMDEIIPSWEKMKSWQNVNKNDLNKLIGLLYRRKNNAEAIYYRMKANQWLTSGEEAMVAEDKSLYDQAEILAKKLNGK
jgi:signal peptidase I